MSSTTTPSTIEGIKRLAVTLKREQGIPHHQALNAAAQHAGLANFRHARAVLVKSERSRVRGAGGAAHKLWITAYWQDRGGQSGRETLCISSGVPWCERLRPSEIGRSRGLNKFRVDAADHFESKADLAGRDAARRAICEAARTLQFMELTGLRPATSQGWRSVRNLQDLPGKDHASEWTDPATGRTILVDEPYLDVDQVLEARKAWAQDRGVALAVTARVGMYFPGMATLCFASADGDAASLGRYVAALDAAPAPVTAEHWHGESAPYSPLFLSPARAASGRRKRGRPRPLVRGTVRGRAIVYGHILIGPCWRPDARMPLDSHREAGNLIKEVLDNGRLRSRAWQRLAHVRSELDEWVQREYPGRQELPDDVFPELYYRDFVPSGFTPARAIERIRELITENYPDCVPRRDLLRCIDAARRDLARKQIGIALKT